VTSALQKLKGMK